MNLASRAIEDVQSDEGESAVVVPAVLADVFAVYEAEVHLEWQFAYGCGMCGLVCVCAHPANVGEADEAVEVADDRRVIRLRRVGAGRGIPRRQNVVDGAVAKKIKSAQQIPKALSSRQLRK